MKTETFEDGICAAAPRPPRSCLGNTSANLKLEAECGVSGPTMRRGEVVAELEVRVKADRGVEVGRYAQRKRTTGTEPDRLLMA